ncbi:hypothetical protein VTK73DRAFT_2371 [Phialemonium thermophilum]|uniref:Uncharacterized protein n=1 Tax=Phialemonium thermophilum TaxID=223376 RepID=A0ABR3X4P0_9PEZI
MTLYVPRTCSGKCSDFGKGSCSGWIREAAAANQARGLVPGSSGSETPRVIKQLGLQTDWTDLTKSKASNETSRTESVQHTHKHRCVSHWRQTPMTGDHPLSRLQRCHPRCLCGEDSVAISWRSSTSVFWSMRARVFLHRGFPKLHLLMADQ